MSSLEIAKAKRIWIITLFPNHFEALTEGGVVAQALTGMRDLPGGNIKLELLQLRDFSPKDYKGVDDKPYGGGQGVVMRADVLKNALDAIMEKGEYTGEILDNLHIVYTSPRGKTWSATYAREFAGLHWNKKSDKDLVFICGRYEGIDERFVAKYIAEEISIGDFVVSGGELPVMMILDSALRFVPGVLGNENSFGLDSFESEGLLECPSYTRPAEFEGMTAPEVLLSGDHKKIEVYRRTESERITKEKRPDLFKKYQEQLSRGKNE